VAFEIQDVTLEEEGKDVILNGADETQDSGQYT
jgi:hypothetical protein